MRNEPGVYALVMLFQEERTIKIGKLGTFEFAPGWYIYVGSAHGPGGVKARTNRHQRKVDQKSKKWNIDYFRPYATMHEIWFSHAPSDREHDWAWSVLRMCGAEIPVEKFGANDCHPLCFAHFFRFATHPFLAEFRADLLRRCSGHVPIYTELVEPPNADLVSFNGPANQNLLLAYDRGRRFLELRRRAAYDGLTETEFQHQKLSFANGKFERHLIEEIAPTIGVSVDDLIEDAEFGYSVETLVSSCEEDVFRALFNSPKLQTRKAIMELSRTADTRQRYRIEGVLEGEMRSVAPQNGDYLHVYDTVSFAEVPSRLRRARGTLQKLQISLCDTCPEPVAKEVRRLIELCRKAALQLRRFVKSKSSKEKSVPQALSKERVTPILRCRDVRGHVLGDARGPLALTIKSVWDFPEMQRRGIVPTDRERNSTLAELKTILAIADSILVMLHMGDSSPLEDVS